MDRTRHPFHFAHPDPKTQSEHARHEVLTILVTTFEEFSWIFPRKFPEFQIFFAQNVFRVYTFLLHRVRAHNSQWIEQELYFILMEAI